MTTTPTPSSDTTPTTVWTRRNIAVIAATLTVLPFLLAAVHTTTGAIPRLGGFWPATGFVLLSELVVCFGAMNLMFYIPALRSRLDIPHPDGDERERQISAKANRVALSAALLVLLWVSIGAQFVAAVSGGDVARIPADSLICIMLAVQLIQFGSMIYYSRKL